MSEITSLTIGTRGSKLALAQTQLVAEALKQKHPGIEIKTKVIVTKGDVNQSPIPLDTIGKNWFTAEIEDALLRGEIDIAVHSMKDLPPDISRDLITLPVLERADARDVLITRSGASLKDLPHGAVIGTDSIRRKILLLEQRPDLVVKSIRGNVDTRLQKLRDEPYDAIMLAAAGLQRLGMADRITEFLDPSKFIPAISQGILAAQTTDRGDASGVLAMLRRIQHMPTQVAAEVEQLFSQTVGGGCKVPIGCYARIADDLIHIDAFIQDADGEVIKRKSKVDEITSAPTIGEVLARELLA